MLLHLIPSRMQRVVCDRENLGHLTELTTATGRGCHKPFSPFFRSRPFIR